MKYGYYEVNESPSSIEEYTDGAHIIVLRKVTDFVKNTCILEDKGWSVRDSIKVITETESFHATLFRKPFKGTVANNVLENGCGGINIDATRIKGGGTLDNCSEGRFPANLILIHPNCQKIGVKTVKGTSSDARKKKTSKFSGIFGEGGVATGKAGHGDENGNEIIINYDCVTDCPIQKLDTQSGITKAVKTKKSDNRVENNNQVFGKGLGLHNPANSHKDSGGASRYFKQVHSLEELKEYLTTLIRC
tara:strand:- start:2237 stop:2980 length:744 start_codon:yes stop_codon:yes gene_type:complete